MFSSSFCLILGGVVMLNKASWVKNSWIILFTGLSLALQTPWESLIPMYAIAFYMNFFSGSFWILCILIFVLMSSALQCTPSASTPKSYVLLMLISLGFFLSKSLLWFYLSFEISVLPICYILMASGYQPERLSAGFSLFLYTLTSSMPFFSSMLVFTEVWGIKTLGKIFSISEISKTALIAMSFILCFFIKLPVYFVHMWLPKAHVEAPVVGSMMLAAILLKLGSYGLIIFSSFISHLPLLTVTKILGLAGMLFSSWIALRLSDLKMIIAYSSVAHMGMGLAGLSLFSKVSWAGAILMFISHAFSSSGLFFLAFVMYEQTKSRSILLTKGLLLSSASFAIIWFILSMMSLGAPPSPNFMSEVLLASALVQSSKSLSLALLFSLLPAAAYTFLIYSIVQQSESSLASGVLTSKACNLLTLWAHANLCLMLLSLIL